jgi:hypothetical protein
MIASPKESTGRASMRMPQGGGFNDEIANNPIMGKMMKSFGVKMMESKKEIKQVLKF